MIKTLKFLFLAAKDRDWETISGATGFREYFIFV